MKYGHFDDEQRQYVITTPHTPFPWINYLGTSDFFSLISHTGGGYCFYRDARLRRILRYRYNNVPLDRPGRYLYLVVFALAALSALVVTHLQAIPPGERAAWLRPGWRVWAPVGAGLSLAGAGALRLAAYSAPPVTMPSASSVAGAEIGRFDVERFDRNGGEILIAAANRKAVRSPQRLRASAAGRGS